MFEQTVFKVEDIHSMEELERHNAKLIDNEEIDLYT